MDFLRFPPNRFRAALASVALFVVLGTAAGCLPAIAAVVQGLADSVSQAVDVELNEFGPSETTGLQFQNQSDASVTVEVDLDQGEGLTNNGAVVVGAVSLQGLEVAPGQVLGQLDGRLSVSELALFTGFGLYPCVRGEVCVRAFMGDQLLGETCPRLGEDFDCGDALVFTIRPDRRMVLTTRPLGSTP